MKRSTIFLAAMTLVIVFVGGMSASGLVNGKSTEEAINIRPESNLDEIIESSLEQIGQEHQISRSADRLIVSDFEVLM